MKFNDANSFIKNSSKTLTELYDMFKQADTFELSSLKPGNTALVIIDMINGFAREGALMSARVEELIPGIVSLSRKCDEAGIAKIAFADCHTGLSPEFGSYPVHCIRNTSEAEIVNEIKQVGGYKLIQKNSTNGFLEQDFQNWLKENSDIDTFIIVGDCTDICIEQFAESIKTWFNMQNKDSRVIVPIDLVDTYDLGVHNADLMNVMALYNMFINGIEVVAAIL
jgi:nicotinamidase-related amidase